LRVIIGGGNRSVPFDHLRERYRAFVTARGMAENVQ
jgi:hypothetical protein